MNVRRLSWAGLEVEAGATTVVIDLLQDVSPFAAWLGDVDEELVAPAAEPGTLDAALVTHSHPDHLDVPSLTRALAPGAPVLCPAETAGIVAKAGLQARAVAPWESVQLGALTATAVPAVDGVGEVQVSWVVEHDGRRLIHCGDTMFHGAWWPIRERTGPFDLAVVPINGAIVDFPHVQPATGLPAAMTPEEAAAAAHVLRASEAMPMHYGTFHLPPYYVSLPDPEAAFVAASERRGVPVRVLRPGEALELGAVPA